MKAKSLIAILLGSLILVYVGHNIMPHHHHMDGVHAHAGCDRHDAGAHAGDADDPASHCHAFNGIEYVLSVEHLNLHPAQVILRSCPDRPSRDDEPLLQEFTEHRNRGPANDCPGFLGETSGLRAPPQKA